MDCKSVFSQLLKLLLPLAWMGVIFYLSSQSDLSLNNEFAVWNGVVSVVAHLIEYGVLAFLLKLNLQNYWVVGMVALIYAFSDEWHQYYVPGRKTDSFDILVDMIGIVIGLYLFSKIKEKATSAKSNL